MSFISRLWNSMRSPIRLIGRDLQGNTYHEAPSPNDPSRPKRFVQYKEQGDVWNHIAGQKHLPVQWSSWLTYTRAHPPTLEVRSLVKPRLAESELVNHDARRLQELQADMARQERVRANVARIQTRDRAEEEEMLRIRQRDAQQALIDAAAVHVRPEGVEDAPEASSSIPPPAPPLAMEAGMAEPASSKPPAVLPPTFLTPSMPRKGKNTGKFRLPPVDWSANDVAADGAPIPEEKTTTQQREVPYAPSKPVGEMESWTPKAIRRGQ